MATARACGKVLGEASPVSGGGVEAEMRQAKLIGLSEKCTRGCGELRGSPRNSGRPRGRRETHTLTQKAVFLHDPGSFGFCLSPAFDPKQLCSLSELECTC